MVGKRIGGVNVFGGGLALDNSDEKIVGAPIHSVALAVGAPGS